MTRAILPFLLLFFAVTGCSVTLDPTLSPTPDAGTDAQAVPDGQCVPVEGSSGRYLVCAALASFDDAAASCAAEGAVLASVSSAEDNALLAASTEDLDTHTNLWLGGFRDDELVWRWPDGTIFWTGAEDGAAPGGVFANWKAGEPNDSSTVVDEPERCAALTLFDTQWNDRACSLELSYFCEFDLE